MAVSNGWKFGANIRADRSKRWDATVNILEEMFYERVVQQAKWGDDADLSQHELLSITLEELGEVAKDINDITILQKRLNLLSSWTPEQAQQNGFETGEALERGLARALVEFNTKIKNLQKEWVQVGAMAAKSLEILRNNMDAIQTDREKLEKYLEKYNGSQ